MVAYMIELLIPKKEIYDPKEGYDQLRF